MNKVKKITLKDLRSLYDLECWIRESTNKFLDKKISAQNMLIVVDYLLESIKKDTIPDKELWTEAILMLKKRAENNNEQSV